MLCKLAKANRFKALTRIVELEEDSIEIDSQYISRVDLKALIDQITMIPQDPNLFTGSLRFNLDPFDQHADERIIDLIKKAGLGYLLEGSSKQELEDRVKKEQEQAQKKKELKERLMGESTEEEDEKKKGDKKVDAEKEKKVSGKKAQDVKYDDGKGLNFKVQEDGKNLSVGER